MTPLEEILDAYRDASRSEREKGTYFEELIATYLRNEATYRDLYSDVWTYAAWAREQGLDARDTGIDLVARTRGTGEYHAIQCKLYAEDYRLQKKDIDSFFTASGRKPFTHRIIVSTTNHWSEHAEDALRDQQPPVSKIDLFDLENSQIDWSAYKPHQEPVLKERKSLRPHQESAVKAVTAGLSDADRGKLIMACGTGKTFTSLKIAEELAGKGGRVLFLVPSLALLSQTLTEWTQQSEVPLHSFAVCSDSDVGKKRRKNDDEVQTYVHELRYPATTDGSRLATEMAKRHDAQHMSVVFSTYHSISAISEAQHDHGLDNFDVIVCDEAHRTTGATFADEDESNFVKVHDADFIRSTKRIYMTATPRIYGDSAKASAEDGGVTLCSMDDEALYGKRLFTITFSDAVKRGLLVDYKVIVLAVEEAHVSRRIQGLLKDGNNQLRVDDASKIVGCWKALSKQGLVEELNGDDVAMQRAVAFCQVIEISKGTKTHKVSSKNIANMFQAVVEAYQEAEETEDRYRLFCEAEHVDGSMNASEKEAKIAWLKAKPKEGACRVLSNVRCLSEGVDVPALDAVLFLTPRNSQVDVVQSVGRVMRNAPGKKLGYVILPVVIPAGVEPHDALNDNQTYKVVWQVLQALRSHDDRFDAMVNKLDLIGQDTKKMEVVAITDKVQRKSPRARSNKEKARANAKGKHSIGEPEAGYKAPEQGALEFEIGEIERAIYAKLVQKVGNRHHWEDWANDIAKIARTHIDRIEGILEKPENTEARDAFEAFAKELRDDLNDSITEGEIVEMLAQHLITKPVFDALFADHSFAANNPMSLAMQRVLDTLQEHRLDKEAATLEGFYESVKLRAEGIDNAQGKQKIVVELYDKFFRNAFPRMTERLGIVYTPVEIVDFILRSVDHILRQEFDQSLGSEGVHILDPFTGTGTFITRLMQSGLITPEQLVGKYRSEIHANEIVLLAYYIAAVNIEAAYHDIVGGDYVPFEGICLTDTFQLYEKDDLVSELLVDNSARRTRQKELDITVVVSNPPYSIGQNSQNDNNKNVGYPNLDARINATYAKMSESPNSKGLYDSYIRAIRWASDRIGTSGVIGFVTNAGFLEASTADGLRKCLVDEFSNIYVFHLRGNQRTSGEVSRREGGKVFGSGSRAPIAISFLVKNPRPSESGKVYFHDIGDYLTREAKLSRIEELVSIEGINQSENWRTIVPDDHGDWLKQRDNSFSEFIVLGARRTDESRIFELFSQGILTSRDAWCYGFSRRLLKERMRKTIAFFNAESQRFDESHASVGARARMMAVDNFIDVDPTKISWSRSLKKAIAQGREITFDESCVRRGLYRPFTKQWVYFNREMDEYLNQIPRFFPSAESENKVIVISNVGSKSGFSAIMVDVVPDFQVQFNSQCFPLYVYDHEINHKRGQSDDLLGSVSRAIDLDVYRRDGLTDVGLSHFQAAYHGEHISKEEVFFYIYGLFHSEEYREWFADNLSKEIPRVPCVKKAVDFWSFSRAGRELAELHLNYESSKPFPVKIEYHGKRFTDEDFRVEKMRYGKQGREKDLTTLHYNAHITVTGIPLEAYDYVVNGKPALDWVIERQRVKEDKASGIVNDANDWAIETMHNPRYPLELFQRVITVSLETMKIVRSLPRLDIAL